MFDFLDAVPNRIAYSLSANMKLNLNCVVSFLILSLDVS